MNPSHSIPSIPTRETRYPTGSAVLPGPEGRIGRVRCIQTSEATDPAFRVGEVYDLYDLRCYGNLIFFHMRIAGGLKASLASDFEIIEIGANPIHDCAFELAV